MMVPLVSHGDESVTPRTTWSLPTVVSVACLFFWSEDSLPSLTYLFANSASQSVHQDMM